LSPLHAHVTLILSSILVMFFFLVFTSSSSCLCDHLGCVVCSSYCLLFMLVSLPCLKWHLFPPCLWSFCSCELKLFSLCLCMLLLDLHLSKLTRSSLLLIVMVMFVTSTCPFLPSPPSCLSLNVHLRFTWLFFCIWTFVCCLAYL
jgi:hypothetical protein